MRSRRGGPLQFVLVLVVLGGGAVALGLLDRSGTPVAGQAQVHDGDTISLDGNRIRLVGIDAPEYAQTCMDRSGGEWPCGKAARDAMLALVKGRQVSCLSEGRDKYGRMLGRCSVGKTDLGAAMIEAGLAVSYDDYKLRETAARAGGRGIWAGSFVIPSEWRRTSGEAEPEFDFLTWLLGLFR